MFVMRDGDYGLDSSRYDGRKHFVAIYHFCGWDHVSLGGHVCLSLPNIEIHLPFGFIRVGWILNPDIEELRARERDRRD